MPRLQGIQFSPSYANNLFDDLVVKHKRNLMRSYFVRKSSSFRNLAKTEFIRDINTKEKNFNHRTTTLMLCQDSSLMATLNHPKFISKFFQSPHAMLFLSVPLRSLLITLILYSGCIFPYQTSFPLGYIFMII